MLPANAPLVVFEPFENYQEIPTELARYFVTVAGVEKIESVPLADINQFLEGFWEYQSRVNEQDRYAEK